VGLISFKKFIIEATKKEAVVFVFGRMNPPTKGHEAMVDFAIDFAKKNKADLQIYTSATQDKKKNPIGYNDKVKFLKKLFPKGNITKSKLKTPFTIAEDLNDKYKQMYFIVGGDRTAEFTKVFGKYYDNLEVVESGGRSAGVSATDQRNYAKDDDFESFKKGLPSGTNDKLGKQIFDATRKGLK